MRLVEPLDKLGISLKTAGGETKAVETVFVDLMRKLDGVENRFERNAILADIFGRSGLKMSVMLGEGSEALERLAASSHRCYRRDHNQKS